MSSILSGAALQSLQDCYFSLRVQASVKLQQLENENQQLRSQLTSARIAKIRITLKFVHLLLLLSNKQSEPDSMLHAEKIKESINLYLSLSAQLFDSSIQPIYSPSSADTGSFGFSAGQNGDLGLPSFSIAQLSILRRSLERMSDYIAAPMNTRPIA